MTSVERVTRLANQNCHKHNTKSVEKYIAGFGVGGCARVMWHVYSPFGVWFVVAGERVMMWLVYEVEVEVHVLFVL